MLAVKMVQSVNVHRVISMSVMVDYRHKRFKYKKGSVPETREERENRKYWNARMPKLQKGELMPRAYYAKTAQVSREKSNWDKMTSEDRESADEANFYGAITHETRADWIASKKSNIQSSSPRYALPGLPGNIQIEVRGTGDPTKFNQKSNERYHQYETVELFSAKFNKRVGAVKTKTGKKNQKEKRPEMIIYPSSKNPSSSKVSVDSLSIHPELKAGLIQNGIATLSQIQVQILANFYTHNGDIIAISETGSGKTLAYLLIALEEWLQNGKKTLIVTTNTILLSQIKTMAWDILKQTEIDYMTIFKKRHENGPIRVNAVSSPTLLNSAMEEYSILVVDEAQCILNEYSDQYLKIRNNMKENIRVMAFLPFSISKSTQQNMSQYFNDPIVLETEFANCIPLHIKQVFKRLKKVERDINMLKTIKDGQPTILFVNNKNEMIYVSRILQMYDITFLFIDKRLKSDEKARKLSIWKRGEISLIVTTDALHAGLNLPTLRRVINWSPPQTAGIYLNRLGRLGRIDSNFIGECITYCVTVDHNDTLQRIEEAVRRNVKMTELDKNYDFNEFIYKNNNA